MFFFDAQIGFQPQTPKSPQNRKSHLKIQNLTSKSKISPQNPKSQYTYIYIYMFVFVNVIFVQLFKDAPSETLIVGLCWGQQ